MLSLSEVSLIFALADKEALGQAPCGSRLAGPGPLTFFR